MTSIDLKDAFYSISIQEGDKWKIAFHCQYGHFEFIVIPMGLVNSLAIFQSYINKVLDRLINTICIAYLNDILIYLLDLEIY